MTQDTDHRSSRRIEDGPATASPLEVVQDFGEAWAAHDLDRAVALLADDCLFDATGPAPDGTRHDGPESIRAAWKEIFDDATARFEAEETFSAGDRIVQRWRYAWNGGHVRGVDLFTVRAGRIVEKLSYVKG